MNVIFANLAMLPWTLLAATPLLVHLFARSRPRPFEFSSVRLLSEIVRRTSRLQRPRSWLILILRTLLFLAIVAMMLRPVWMSSEPLAGFDQRKQVFILLDRSASMAAQDGSRTRFAAGAARASEILAGLSGEDQANIIWVGAQAEPEFPSPSGNRKLLRETLVQAGPKLEAANWPAAFNEVRRQLKQTTGAEVHVISDFQASNWAEIEPALPEQVEVLFINAAREGLGNQVLQSLTSSESGDGSREITAEVRNYSEEPVLRTLFLRANEQVESRQLRLGPGSTGGASFQIQAGAEQEMVVELALDDDAYPMDNTRHLLLAPEEALRVGISGMDELTRRQWERALQAIEWIELVPIDPARKTPPAVAIWMVAGWDGEESLEALREFQKSGGSLVLLPETGTPVEAATQLLGLPAKETAWQTRRNPQGFNLVARDPEEPILAIFEGGEFGDPAGGRVADLVGGVDWEKATDWRVILETTTAQPLLAVRTGQDKAALWLAPLRDAAWSGRPEFVPLLGELLFALRPERPVAQQTFITGQRLVRRFDRPVLAEELEVAGPDRNHPVTALAGEGQFATEPVSQPGVYEWRYRGSPVGRSVVHFPETESDLEQTVDPNAILVAGKVLGVEDSVSALREGQPLWPWLLALAMAVALTESLVVWRTQREAGV